MVAPKRTITDPRRLPVEPHTESLPAIPAQRLEAAALRTAFRDPRPFMPELLDDRFRLFDTPPRPAAVLVPIVDHRDGPAVLLTRRTEHLSDHAGQIAFPGGRVEPADESVVHTALRETDEEIGLAPARVEVIGTLPDYLTGTGYRIAPVVGLIEPGFTLRLDPFEVAEVFEVPLAFLMDPANHERRRFKVEQIDRVFLSMPYRPPRSTTLARTDEAPPAGGQDAAPEYFIWGATAAMIRNLYRFLAG